MLFYRVGEYLQERAVGRALKRLEKDNRIGSSPVTKMVYLNENSYAARDEGTLQAFWVLISLMKKRTVSSCAVNCGCAAMPRTRISPCWK